MQKLNLGLIGAGRIVNNAHAKILIRIRDKVNPIAVADVNIESANKMAEVLGIKYVMSDYKDLLRMREIDAVLITVPNYLHSIISAEALKAGKHVLCEKPMAIKQEEAEMINNIYKTSNKIMMIAVNNRFRQDFKFLKHYIDSGQLGEIYQVKCGWLRRAGIPDWGGWFSDKSRSGGGVLLDLGVHLLDLALFMLDFPIPHSVLGTANTIFGNLENKHLWVRSISDPTSIFNVEDMATAFIRFSNNTSLNLDVCWAGHIEKDSFFLQLIGTKGGAFIENENGLTIFKEQFGIKCRVQPDIVIDHEGARIEMWEHFLNCIHSGSSTMSSPDKTVLVHQILDAIYQSINTGRPIVFSASN